MQMRINPGELSGDIAAIPSKSHAHRLLICAALSDRETRVACPAVSGDILATADGLNTLCGGVKRQKDGFAVSALRIPDNPGYFRVNCADSGSTYRFLLPLALMLPRPARFMLSGRLPHRPMNPLFKALEAHGAELSGKGTDTLDATGHMRSGFYRLPGGVSSQFISGLIFALPLLTGKSEIAVDGAMESRGYINMTLDTVRRFGVCARVEEDRIVVPGSQRYRSPGDVTVEGDWSAAAFYLCAAACAGRGITVTGLSTASEQLDKTVLSLLRRFGADVTADGDRVSVAPRALSGIEIDAADIPDLVPALALVAACARDKTVIYNASRLRLKESDRLKTVAGTLNALGGDVRVTGEGLLINGTGTLRGGTVDACSDHRIAMMAACASVLCIGPVTLAGAEAVRKSYPAFFGDFRSLGRDAREEGEK